MDEKPWTTGPKELLNHAEGHLSNKESFDYRIAFISIDNAVELTIQTFLSLPRRVKGFEGPSRKELESANYFPDLLDMLEKYGGDRITGIELGDIEWYHRLRNSLYHEGNGITVDPDKVDAYFQIANLLFKKIFDLPEKEEYGQNAISLLGVFILKWAFLENRIYQLAEKNLPRFNRGTRSVISFFDGLIAKGIVDTQYRETLNELIYVRNSVVHSGKATEPEKLREYINEIDHILKSIPE
jgi:uncharacterized protein YutE (UPF0331/DUF86 family)